jgi:peptide-methionine (S)-S-oxide reductase
MRRQRAILVAAVTVGLGYAWLRGGFVGAVSTSDVTQAPPAAAAGLETATFAAGCFWCAEADFEKLPGVVTVTSGYTGGHVRNPTYKQVSRGGTGHVESVQVLFDPARISYDTLLGHFWHDVDPFVSNRQFCDVGDQYRAEIFVHNVTQRAAAEESKRKVQQRFSTPIVVRISDAGVFYPAESYHQNYAKMHPVQYRFYRWTCGRDARLRQIWGRPTDAGTNDDD